MEKTWAAACSREKGSFEMCQGMSHPLMHPFGAGIRDGEASVNINILVKGWNLTILFCFVHHAT
jgi:hypothetical protein